MQAVFDACASGRLRAAPRVAISNNRDAEALERATRAGIPGYHLSSVTHPEAAVMYGASVHEAVLAAGERETGVTIHVVDGEYDHGPIVAQCRVPIHADDTPATLAARVLEREHAFLVETLEGIVSGALMLPS